MIQLWVYEAIDWEAIADCAPDELLSSQSLPKVANLSLEDTKVQASKRRGRGTFTYNKNELYSDRQSDKSAVEDVVDEDTSFNLERSTELTYCKPCFSLVSVDLLIELLLCLVCFFTCPLINGNAVWQ